MRNPSGGNRIILMSGYYLFISIQTKNISSQVILLIALVQSKDNEAQVKVKLKKVIPFMISKFSIKTFQNKREARNSK